MDIETKKKIVVAVEDLKSRIDRNMEKAYAPEAKKELMGIREELNKIELLLSNNNSIAREDNGIIRIIDILFKRICKAVYV